MLFCPFSGITDVIATAVLGDLPMQSIFPELTSHMMEMTVTENHVFQLVKKIAKNYCKVRFYHMGREFSDKATGEKVRKKLSKLIHFKGQ